MIIKKRIATLFLCLALILTIGGEFALSLFPVRASASSSEYTNVLDDLMKDDSFNPDDYPAYPEDYSIEVIQIAEGVNGEVFLYVYHPSSSFCETTASSLVLSLKDGDEYTPEKYTLQFINRNGVFSKYLISGLTINTGDDHKYLISSICRPYNDEIDIDFPIDNTIQEIAYPVGQSWNIYYVDGEAYADMLYEDYIQVTSKHVGFARYKDYDISWIKSNTDSHYIAFSTNKSIDSIDEVDVSFNYEEIQYHYQKSYITGVEKEWTDILSSGSKKVTISSDQLFEKNNSLWFPDYEYMRIQKVSDLLKNEGNEMSDTTKSYFKDKQWVVRFYETTFATINTSNSSAGYESFRVDSTKISKVVMLRIKYNYQGKVYNLGVVDNVQSGNDIPDWYNDNETDWFEKIVLILGIIAILLFLSAFSGPITFILSILIDGIKCIFKITINVFLIPLKFLLKVLKTK